jgi:lysophospholipase L1-like esterase
MQIAMEWPMKSSRRPVLPLLGAAALGVLLFSSGCAVWRISQSAELARQSEPYQQRPADATLRLLVVGDSTAVGTGASVPAASVAGLLGAQQPRLWIDNRGRDGARFSDLPAQLTASTGRFDIVLVQAGGNDVIRLSNAASLRSSVDAVARLAREKAPLVLLLPSGNVGNAPFFVAPMSWWMTSRSRDLHAIVREAAQRHGAVYVDLFKERDDDPFVKDKALNARDGLHPSDAGYRVWRDELMAQSPLAAVLAQGPRQGAVASDATDRGTQPAHSPRAR